MLINKEQFVQATKRQIISCRIYAIKSSQRGCMKAYDYWLSRIKQLKSEIDVL